MTLAEIKGRLRAGPWAWPGGYPIYFVTSDGAALSFKAVRAEWRNIVRAHLWNEVRCDTRSTGSASDWRATHLQPPGRSAGFTR